MMITKNFLPGAGRSFAILTLGCKVNTYESDLISQQMRYYGFTEKTFNVRCDIYIVNTCTVTNIADRKSRKMLHRARKLNPEALIVAAGCYADAVAQDKGLPDAGVDLWVLNQEKAELAEKILAFLDQKAVVDTIIPDVTEPQLQTVSGRLLTRLDGHTRAFLKIEDGCNLFCTYCIIPYVRGRVKSRAVEDTVKEAALLAESGVTEVVLTGIHLSSMGDQLLETIEAIGQIPGILRIRLGSLEPRWVTPEVVKRLQACSKLCPHFHLSLQSGSDSVLKRMNRHYTSEEFYNIVGLLREAFPLAAITTDIITGFPGETEEEFQETMDFAEKVRFYEAHVFPYSRRKGTVADRMPAQIPEQIKEERSTRLIAETATMSTEFRKQFLGKIQEFLVEETIIIGDQPYLTGYTRQYVRCMLPCSETKQIPEPGKLLSGTAIELKNQSSCGDYLLLTIRNTSDRS